MLHTKRAESFGAIIAIIGSVLIALGIVWLLAQNWHAIPATLKIIILLGATAAAFGGGVLLQDHDFPGTGKSLIVLGGLLYTWSIFLIAQIFATESTLQGTATLLLLAWVGVIFASYVFDSRASLIVGMIELCIWTVLQFFAFYVHGNQDPSFGLLAILFLVLGALMYGLSLMHRSRDHKFGSLYQIWTAFYLMAFAYILSFQLVLPFLWHDGTTNGGAITLIVFAAVIALGFIIYGLSVRSNRTDGANIIPGKELVGVGILFGLLLVLILSAGLISANNGAGYCSAKSCYQISDSQACAAATCSWNTQSNSCTYKTCDAKTVDLCKQQGCNWQTAPSRCESRDCYRYTDGQTCAANQCSWSGSSCSETDKCVGLTTQTTCESSNSCEWIGNSCRTIPQSCYNFQSQTACQRSGCNWVQDAGYCSNSAVDSPTNACPFTSKDACNAISACEWNNRPYFGEETKSPSSWAIWIFSNLVFVALILAVIGYGTWLAVPSIINLGIAFFALDILTRYIGFLIDLWGYMTLSLVFIAGGIVLIGGGYFVEKWRRKLVKGAREEQAR